MLTFLRRLSRSAASSLPLWNGLKSENPDSSPVDRRGVLGLTTFFGVSSSFSLSSLKLSMMLIADFLPPLMRGLTSAETSLGVLFSVVTEDDEPMLDRRLLTLGGADSSEPGDEGGRDPRPRLEEGACEESAPRLTEQRRQTYRGYLIVFDLPLGPIVHFLRLRRRLARPSTTLQWFRGGRIDLN